jgi:hypothetical protein
VVQPTERSNMVRISDMRLVGPSLGTSVKEYAAAIRQYAVAHGMRAIAGDLGAVHSRLTLPDVMDALGLDDEFFKALPAGVASCGSPEDLDAWALQWFNSKQDWLTVDSLDDVLGFAVRRYREQRNKIDDGRERWYVVGTDMRYAMGSIASDVFQKAIEGGMLNDEILSQPNVSFSSYIPTSFFADGVSRKLVELLFEENDYIELKVAVTECRAAMSLNSTSRLYVENWANAISLTMGLLSGKWQSMVGWAKKAKVARALDSAGVDVHGMLRALGKVPGILLAEVGSTDQLKTADRYSASYAYQAGTYINLSIARGSDTFEKVAQAGADGLQGRTFDKVRKVFRVTVADDQKFSDGKKVASVTDLFKHLGLNISDYML